MTLVPMPAVSLLLTIDTPVTARSASTPTIISMLPWEPDATILNAYPANEPPERTSYASVTFAPWDDAAEAMASLRSRAGNSSADGATALSEDSVFARLMSSMR